MEVERSTQAIRLNGSQLLFLVRRAFPDCQRLDEWKLLSGGAFNTTYKIQIGKNAFVVRLYARGRSYCKKEKAIYQFIDTSIPTPTLLYVDESYEPWPYSIFEFISGVHISEAHKGHKTSLCYELGRVLGSIHAVKFSKAGLFGEGVTVAKAFQPGSSPYFEEAFSVLSKEGHARRRLGDRLADTILAFMQRNKDFFPKVGDNICLVHSDFKPVNLLYHSSNTIFVLDWEFAHAGLGILDFSILLRHRSQFPFDRSALEREYTDSGGNLSDEWFRSALITDLVNIVTLMEAPFERPKLFHQLKYIIQTTIDNWGSTNFIRL